MIIKRLKLINFGKHKSLEFNNIEYGSIVGLFGKNGAGKSSILTAIDFAFTRRLPETVESFIHNGEKSGSVELDFLKDGKEGKIVRKLGKSTSSVLEWDGSKLTKTADIDIKISEILGVDKQMLDNTVFIKQGAIAELLTATPAKRLELFIKLLNLDFISKRFQTVDKYQSSLKDTVENVGLLKDELTLATAECIELETKYKNDLENANVKYISEESLCKLKDTISLYKLKNERIESYIKDIKDIKDTGINEDTLFLEDDKCNDIKAKMDLHRKKRDEAYVRSITLSNTRDYCCSNILDPVARFSSMINTFASVGGLSKAKERLNYVYQVLVDKDAYDISINKISELERSISIEENNYAKYKSELDAINTELTNNKSTYDINSTLLSNLNILYDTKLKLKNRLKKDDVTCPICGLKLLLGQEITDGDITSIDSNIKYIEGIVSACKENIKTKSAELKIVTDNINFVEANLKLIKSNLGKYKEDLEKVKYVESIDINELKNEREDLNNKIRLAEYQLVRSKSVYIKMCKDIHNISDDQKHMLNIIKNNAFESEFNAASCETEKHKYAYEECEKAWCELQTKKIDLAKRIEKLKLLNTQLNDTIKSKNSLNLTDIISSFNNFGLDKSIACDINFIEASIIPEGLDVYKNIHVSKAILDSKKYSNEELSKKIKTIENKNEKIYKVILDLETTKNIINIKDANSLPRAYIDYLIEKIVNTSSDLLFKMNSNFIIDIDKEECCGFKFKRTDINDDFWMPMSKLSGGQRVKLSIVLLLAIHEIICPNLGLLVLDEPSTHLDNDSTIALADTFRELSGVMKNRKSQLWIVDHNEDLSDCADAKLNI